MIKPTCSLLILFLSLPAFAEESKVNKTPPTLEETIPSSVINNKEDTFFTLTTENDSFGGNSDRNYTNGIMLTWFDRSAKVSPLANWLAGIIPNFKITETTSIYYSIGHNIYTPKNIDIAVPDTNDRPYAGFLYGAVGFSDVEDNHIDDMEITFGVVGPAAFGEEIQGDYHKLIGIHEPKGWDYQIKNEPALMFSWQRKWPEALTFETWGDSYFRVMPHMGVTLGNVYTYANAGFTVQFMPKGDRWQSQPLRVRPSIPGSGFFSDFEDNWSWMLFAGVDGRAIARNIFLDGNTFEDSASVDKRYFVADANAGVAFSYGNARIAYTMNYRTKEFDNQEKNHVFGAISLGYRF